VSTAALLLTGGSSRRLGTDKATLIVSGERLVDRLARVLVTECDPVLEVGPGYGTLPAVREDPPGGGPLAAVAAGATALVADGHEGPAIVLAVDLPGVTAAIIGWLLEHPSPDSVVPVVDEITQVLCARYTADALATAVRLVRDGARSMHALLDAAPVHEAGADEWRSVAVASAFADVDSRAEAAAAGIDLPG